MRVVVLGGGLAGVAVAHELGDEGVAVTLVDRNDYHQFQPLLYQVATSQLPARGHRPAAPDDLLGPSDRRGRDRPRRRGLLRRPDAATLRRADASPGPTW